MGMVAPEQRIASAFVVYCGEHGDVSRQALERGVCRQRVYREAAWVWFRVEGSRWQQENARLRQQVQDLEDGNRQLQQRLAQAIILDPDKQTEFACVGQAMGVSLPELKTLLEVLMSGGAPSVATLGRWTQEAGKKSAALLEVLDEWARPCVQQVVADEIYVNRAALMMVEPESLCWVTGRLTERVDGVTWAEEFERLPHLEQVTRDAGSGLTKGVEELNRRRQEQGKSAVAGPTRPFSHAAGRGSRSGTRRTGGETGLECGREGGGGQSAPSAARATLDRL